MRSKSSNKKISSERRQKRVRQKIKGTQEKPRLSVYRSLGLGRPAVSRRERASDPVVCRGS